MSGAPVSALSIEPPRFSVKYAELTEAIDLLLVPGKEKDFIEAAKDLLTSEYALWQQIILDNAKN